MKRLLSVLLICAWLPGVAAAALTYDPFSITPLRRDLPSGLDYLESGLYWMQDWTGAENPHDPASFVALMEDQMARYFDFGYIAFRVGGPRYAAKNVLARSHFQNRVRDRLFEIMARDMGWTGDRMPRFWPVLPRRSGPNSIVMGGRFAHFRGPLITLEMHFYFSNRGWRVFDVTHNGRSLTAALRADYHAGRL